MEVVDAIEDLVKEGFYHGVGNNCLRLLPHFNSSVVLDDVLEKIKKQYIAKCGFVEEWERAAIQQNGVGVGGGGQKTERCTRTSVEKGACIPIGRALRNRRAATLCGPREKGTLAVG